VTAIEDGAAVLDVLTIAELMDRWRGGVSRGTLANWRCRGEGPPWRKIGSVVLYPLAGIIEYERSRTVDGGGRWWKPSTPPSPRPAPRRSPAPAIVDPFS